MILHNNDIVFIDFGLGMISDLIEDKGVDLLVFKKSISGTHHGISEKCFKNLLKGYRHANDYKAVINEGNGN